jgi:hypothetical protein
VSVETHAGDVTVSRSAVWFKVNWKMTCSGGAKGDHCSSALTVLSRLGTRRLDVLDLASGKTGDIQAITCRGQCGEPNLNGVDISGVSKWKLELPLAFRRNETIELHVGTVCHGSHHALIYTLKFDDAGNFDPRGSNLVGRPA